MTKEKQEEINVEKLPTLNVGLVGHIDHGKTTLLSRLTGKWTDSHSEELKRGITIKLGYADVIIRKKGDDYGIEKDSGKAERYVTFIDAPGHEMLMATTLSGAAIMDAAILLIAANEGIMPQTREHLLALQARNIKNIIIVQNKIDLLSKEKVLESYKAIKEFVKGTIAENAPIIPCSAQQNVNIDKIFKELTKISIPERKEDSEPVFVIARSFDINKPGTKISELKGAVLGGALNKGKIKVGDNIEIKPGFNYKKENQMIYETIKTKVKAIFKGNHKVNEVSPGGSLALETELDPTIAKADSLSGNVVGLDDKLPEIVHTLKLKYTLFEEVFGEKENQKIAPIKTPELLMLSVNTTITVGTVKKIINGVVEMTLKIPVVDFKGSKVGIARNMNNHWRLIGFGEIC